MCAKKVSKEVELLTSTAELASTGMHQAIKVPDIDDNVPWHFAGVNMFVCLFHTFFGLFFRCQFCPSGFQLEKIIRCFYAADSNSS